MISTCRKLFDLLNHRERRRFGLLLGLVVLAGLADMAGVAAILPFLAVVAEPGVARENAWLAAAYDGLGFRSDGAFLVFLGSVVFAVILLALGVKLASIYGLSRFSHMRNHSISNRLLDGLIRQPYAVFPGRNSADLGKTVLHEVDRVVVEGLMPAIRLVAHAVSLTCLVVLLVVVEPWVALCALGGLGLAYGGIFLAARRALGRFGATRTAMNADRYRIAQDALSGIKEVKVHGLETAYTDRYGSASLRLARAAAAAQAIGELPRHLLEAIAFGGMVALVLVLLLNGGGAIADIIPTLGVFAFAGLKMFPSLQQMYHAATLLRFIAPMVDSVHREFRQTQAGAAARMVQQDEPVAPLGRIELRDIVYRHPDTARAALDGLSLSFSAPGTVGLVGGSGAGKTTLVDVLLGLLEPQEGTILVNGRAIAPARNPAWRRSVGYVPQTIHLVDGTIAENIAFGVPGAAIDVAAVRRAARIACLHDFVETQLPEGYATRVGERGLRLSGGERQRIGIARAIYRNPDILILDEATSALDTITERAVMQAVCRAGSGKTVIMVAHRLSTVRNCDRIFLLDEGRVAAAGTYADLERTSGTFRQMAAA